MLAQKQKAIDLFNQKLLKSPISKQIAKVFLFGSTARGTESQESDIDLMLFSIAPRAKIAPVIDKIAGDIFINQNEIIEPLIYNLYQYFNPQSLLVYNTIKMGKELYSMSLQNLRFQEASGWRQLSREYLKNAKQNKDLKIWRIAVDAGYNSAELCVKALLALRLKKGMPTRHAGIVQKFGQLYIKDGVIPVDINDRLRKGLRLRNEARYNPLAEIGQAEASAVISLAQDLLKISEKHFQ